MFKSYIKYFFKAKGAHNIHSPFVYEFYTAVMKRSRYFNDAAIKQIRRDLKASDQEIDFVDLGAGSHKNINGLKRRVSEIVKTSAIRPKYGRLLAHLVEFYRIKSSVELGTSLGIGTSYMALASYDNKVVTVEGSEVLDIALANFEKLGLPNVTGIQGDFHDNLENTLVNGDLIDLIYIDGNHTYQATINYFNFYLRHMGDDSFLIFDDIHWSEEMEKAWSEIAASPSVNLSMDLYQMGIVLKKPGQAKQHFVLRF